MLKTNPNNGLPHEGGPSAPLLSNSRADVKGINLLLEPKKTHKEITNGLYIYKDIQLIYSVYTALCRTPSMSGLPVLICISLTLSCPAWLNIFSLHTPHIYPFFHLLFVHSNPVLFLTILFNNKYIIFFFTSHIYFNLMSISVPVWTLTYQKYIWNLCSSPLIKENTGHDKI